MDPLTLPLDYAAIEKILPHRYPFLLVDRITEFEVDKRIVGIKNISSNERYLTSSPDGPLVLPPVPKLLPSLEQPAPRSTLKNKTEIAV